MQPLPQLLLQVLLAMQLYWGLWKVVHRLPPSQQQTHITLLSTRQVSR
jgi:hypothetical protein